MLPYAEGNGCKTFGAIGTCWGSYLVVRMAAHPKMLAGVSMHPSHSPIMENLGENEEEILNEVQVNFFVQENINVFVINKVDYLVESTEVNSSQMTVSSRE